VPKTQAQAKAYLDACRPALKHFCKLLVDFSVVREDLQRRIDSLLQSLKEGPADPGLSGSANIFYSKADLIAGSGRELRRLREPDRIRHEIRNKIASINATQEAVDIAAGAVLQIAKQSLSFRFGDKKPADTHNTRKIGTQSIIDVIWQGRNHALHWEESEPRKAARTMLEQLKKDCGLDIHFDKNNALAIVNELGWTKVPNVIADLRAIIKSPAPSLARRTEFTEMKPTIALSEAQMKQGIEACFRNAERLKAIALRMLNLDEAAGEGGFALAFAAIRIEELGKVKLLRDRLAASDTSAESWKPFWKKFTTHELKWLTPFEQTFIDLGTTYRDAKALLDENSRKGLEEVEADFRSGASTKNDGLYVDYDENLHSFVEPPAIPDLRARVRMLLDLGDLFEKSLRETSAQSS
jgi:AbiV family abortive infection protein